MQPDNTVQPIVSQPPTTIPTPPQQPPIQQPVTTPNPPVSNPIPPENPTSQNYATVPQAQAINEIPKKNSKKWIILGLLLLFLILVGVGIFVFFQIKSKNTTAQDGSGSQYTYTPIVVPTDTPKPVTIAPPGTPDFALAYYLTSRGTTAKAQQIDKEIGTTIGEIPVPSDLKFIHEEVYKGIPIKWTAGQSVPNDRLAWLKAAIDKLPPFFVVDHPVLGIISATPDELKLTGTSHTQALMGFAYASGLNIFIGNNMLVDDSLHVPPNQKDIDHALFHEWTHVIQYYEALQTFTEDYLKMAGTGQAMRLTPYVHDFAVTVGWDYGGYGPATWDGIPKLKTDADSQKTSDYAKEYEYEDQAETMASLLTCDTGNFSQARIQWAEKVTNTTAASYCH